MRKTLMASSILALGLVVLTSASCGGSSGPAGGGSSGSGGATGAAGSAGAGGSSGKGGGTSGAGGSGAKGSGAMDSGNSGPEDAATAGLTGSEFTPACKTCIAESCFSQFQTCEATARCVAGLDCVAACFIMTGSLIDCGTTCQGDASSSLQNAVREAILCAANACGSGSSPPCPTT